MSKYKLPDTALATPDAPDEEQVESLLESIRPEPDERFYRRIQTQPWHRQASGRNRQWGPALSRRLLGTVATLLIVLLLSIAGFISTPQGQAWAQNLFRFFEPATSESFPLPTEWQGSNVEPTQAPTFAVTLHPYTPPPFSEPEDPATTSEPKEPLFPLTIAEAEAQAGFDVVVPGSIPIGFSFQGASYEAEQRRVTLAYANQSYGGGRRIGIYIFQQRIEDYQEPDCPACDAGHPPDVEEVQLGDVVGEYIGESWILTHRDGPDDQATPPPVWEHTSSLRTLSWHTATTHYIILSLGPEPDGELPGNLGKDTLVDIAESMK